MQYIDEIETIREKLDVMMTSEEVDKDELLVISEELDQLITKFLARVDYKRQCV